MATLKPFRALRPQPKLAREVCTLPYDVMNTEEARDMAEGNPLSFLRVTRSEIEFGPDVDSHSAEVYQHGAAKLQQLIAQGTLIRDDQPRYYLYRQVMGSHSQTGLVAVASCAEYDAGIIKRHELTRPDKEDDRTKHIEILGAQTGPVFLTYRSEPSVDALLAAQTERAPDVDYVADDGIRHSAWVVTAADSIRAIEEAFAKVPALYICDGHHRSAAASRVARARRQHDRHASGNEPWNYFLAVTFPHRQLQILPYNRAVTDLNGLSPEQVLSAIREVADIAPAPADHKPTRKGETTMLLAGQWHLLRWKAALFTGKDPVDSLDVSILQQHLLTPVLGIGNPRTDKRISFVGGIRGTGELERLVGSGDYAIAFAMFPTSLDELIAIADVSGLMPPKSTWFEPKLRDAMMVHMID